MMKRPMKGEAVESLDDIVLPCWAVPKIDGFRCVLTHDGPKTSRLSNFPNKAFHEQAKGLTAKNVTLDSEVTCGKKRGKGVLGRTSSGLTSREGDPDWHIWVFDSFGAACFEDRLAIADFAVSLIGHPRIKMLKYTWIETRKQLKRYLKKQLRKGYEGIMTRAPKGGYKEGKSTLRQQLLLKVKPFETAEGRIIGWFEEEKNNNEAKREATGKLKRSSAKSGKTKKGTLGGFILADEKTKVEVRVGGGFTAAQRKTYWAHIQLAPGDFRGKLVRYKKQTVGEKDRPRHPGFLEFVDMRPEWDYLPD